MQIRESRVEHTDLIYFVFDVSDEIKIFICILSILLITLYGIISGSNKSYKRLILLLVICILLKAGSFLFDYYAPEYPNFCGRYTVPLLNTFTKDWIFSFLHFMKSFFFLLLHPADLFLKAKIPKHCIIRILETLNKQTAIKRIPQSYALRDPF